MKILFIGFGTIAKKHFKIIKKIDPSTEFFSLSKDSKKLKNRGIKTVKINDLENNNLDAIIVCNPSSCHYKTVLNYSRLKLPIMVEKPICINRKQVKILEKLSIQQKDLFIYNACNLRFHPLITFFKDYIKDKISEINEINVYCGSFLPDWRSDRHYTNYYSSKKTLGGGVHLDLIHEIDYTIYLFGYPKSIKKIFKKVSKLNIDSYDFAHYYLDYDSFIVTITLNYFRRDKKRYMEVVMDNDTLFVDLVNDKINSIKDNKSLINIKSEGMEQSYFNQMKYFLNFIKKRESSFNGLQEALKIIKYIL